MHLQILVKTNKALLESCKVVHIQLVLIISLLGAKRSYIFVQRKLYFSTRVWSVILWIWIGWLVVEMLDSFYGCMFLHLDTTSLRGMLLHTEVKMLEFFLYGMAFEAQRHTGEV